VSGVELVDEEVDGDKSGKSSALKGATAGLEWDDDDEDELEGMRLRIP